MIKHKLKKNKKNNNTCLCKYFFHCAGHGKLLDVSNISLLSPAEHTYRCFSIMAQAQLYKYALQETVDKMY